MTAPTAIHAPLGEAMRAKFAALETRRRLHVDGLDITIAAMADLRALDRHLVAQGLHPELQLEHLDTEDPPLDELPEFQDEPVIGPLAVAGNGSIAAAAATPPPDSAKAAPVAPARTKPPKRAEGRAGSTSPTQRRFTDEQKAEAVRTADDLGNDSEAARQFKTTSVSIKAWRNAGHGKRTKSVNETAENRSGKQQPAHDAPQVKCPVCKDKVPIEGEPGIDSRAAALRGHYKVKPACEAELQRRQG